MTESALHTAPTAQPLRTIAAGAFALAVLAGVAETVIALTSIAAEQGLDGAVAAQAVVRGLIFAAALTCARFLAQGRRWAWWALLLGLGVVGLASMLLPMAAALADGASWSVVFEGDVSPFFPAIRGLHILSVLVGVATMLHPEVRASLAGPHRAVRSPGSR